MSADICPFTSTFFAEKGSGFQKPIERCSVCRCPLVERVTSLGWMFTTSVRASICSPVVTMCVVFPMVDWRMAVGVCLRGVRFSSCGGAAFCCVSQNHKNSPPMLMRTIVFVSMFIKSVVYRLFQGNRFSGISHWV